MNLPNKLTTIRMILVVPFVICLLGGHAGWAWFDTLFASALPYMDWAALIIFVVASLTDLFDGKIARKYHMVTNFGKFMDPLADKILVCAAMICLTDIGRIPSWIVIIIVSREFIISGFRLVASDNGIVIAASMWGKYKTTFQMIMIILMIADLDILAPVTTLVMWIAVALTVISLLDYIGKNRQVLSDFR